MQRNITHSNNDINKQMTADANAKHSMF